MSVVSLLEPEVRILCEKHIELFNNEAPTGVTLLVYCTVRTLEEQAKLFRKSRTRPQIDEKKAKLIALGFPELADILENIGPQGTPADVGKHVTHAGPGESFHNYGLAYDAVPLDGGKPLWSDSNNNGIDEYKLYGDIAVRLGLEWAGNWKSFKEYPHVQLGVGTNPLKDWSADKIRKHLKL